MSGERKRTNWRASGVGALIGYLAPVLRRHRRDNAVQE